VTHAHGPYATLVVAWWGMMAVMMLPVTWPWIRTLATLSRGPQARRAAFLHVPSFVLGYLVVWLGFSLACAALQLLIARASPGAALEGAVLAAAGVYQLTPFKAACLRHCRSPFSVLLARWPLRSPALLRLGVEHGLFCLGCCWALMLVGLGAGSMGWGWMAALTALVAAEKLTPVGPSVARWAGGVLIGLAAAAWLAP
jgi:predicted metal-binding membrane protein